jgi:phage host-nuclease inhibitor protein Gam
MHYGQVVRTIDQNHALELTRLANEHERQLAAVRHEIDQAYRREWKAKNREVEKFREDANARVAALEVKYQNQANVHAAAIAKLQQETRDQLAASAEEHELATDKARNAIEDLWEGRWRDRVRLADEEARRMDLENKRRLEQAIADRDEEWVKELGKRHPELLDELRDTISGLRART